MDNDHVGSTLHTFLEEEGMLEEATTKATLRVLAWQIRHDLESRHLTRSGLARIMGTSRSQVNGLMKADGADIKVSTLEKAARALGPKLKIELVQAWYATRAGMMAERAALRTFAVQLTFASGPTRIMRSVADQSS